MPALISDFGWMLAGLALVGCIYVATASILAARFLAKAPTETRDWPSVTIIKPLHGAYPGMGTVLEGYGDQDYPGQVQIVFGVQDPSDPAIEVVNALKSRRPELMIDLIVETAQHGTNRKVSNLINIVSQARHEVLVVSDADIAVGRDYLRHVAGALAGKGVGAVTCLYVGAEHRTRWSRLGAMALNYAFLPNAILGKSLGMAEPCFGSTIALTARTLEEIGGFGAFADHLADDYEIGRAVRAKGLSIAIPPTVVSHICIEPTGNDLLAHELRWGRTVRQIDPGGYVGSLITHPLALALLAGAFTGFSTLANCLIFIALGVRIAAKVCIDAATGAQAGRWWLIPARDLLSFGVFIASFTVNSVGWQGHRFRVGRDGVLSHS